jgi:hypothetical protein
MMHIVEVEAIDDSDDTGPGMRTYGSLISCSEEQLVVLASYRIRVLVCGKLIKRQCVRTFSYPPSPFTFTRIEDETKTLGH